MVLTPREQHQWFLITEHIKETGGLADPISEASAVMAWRYLLSAFYLTVGLFAIAIGLFAPTYFLVPLGLAVTAVGVFHFVTTYSVDYQRHNVVRIHNLRPEGDGYGV